MNMCIPMLRSFVPKSYVYLVAAARIRKTMRTAFLLVAILISAGPFPAATAAPVHFSQAGQFRALVATELEKVAKLRSQLGRGDRVNVGNDLSELNILFDLIDTSRPSGEVDALVTYYKERLAAEDNTQALADVLPLYAALSNLHDGKKVVAARHQLDRVRAALQNGKRSDAIAALGDLQRALTIDGVDFPLQAAEEKLQTIRESYIGNHKLPNDTELFALETNLLEILRAFS
jgi:hypothetical protein